MAGSNMLGTHRTWEDWLSLALGIAIMLAPWIVGETGSRTVVANAALAGLAVMLLAELDLVAFRRWVEVAQLAVGGWVAASPTLLGYGSGGSLRTWHLVAGVLVVLLAVLELWQARRA